MLSTLFVHGAGAPTAPRPSTDAHDLTPAPYGTLLRMILTMINHCDWCKDHLRQPIGLKGIMTAEDARRAVDLGVGIVWVSNHGGRQLDHTQATIDALPAVVDAVAGRAGIVVDGRLFPRNRRDQGARAWGGCRGDRADRALGTRRRRRRRRCLCPRHPAPGGPDLAGSLRPDKRQGTPPRPSDPRGVSRLATRYVIRKRTGSQRRRSRSAGVRRRRAPSRSRGAGAMVSTPIRLASGPLAVGSRSAGRCRRRGRRRPSRDMARRARRGDRSTSASGTCRAASSQPPASNASVIFRTSSGNLASASGRSRHDPCVGLAAAAAALL